MDIPGRRRFLRLLGGAPMSELTDARDTVVRLRSKLADRTRTASGVPLTYGQFQYENQTNLIGTKKWATLDKMVADPHIKGGLNEKTFALWGAKWDVQAASDDPKDIEIRDFVAANLLRESNDRFGREYWVQTSWLQRLHEILGALEHGFALFEMSFRVVDGPGGLRMVYDRLHWLEPSSVDPLGWKLSETDDFEGVYRTYHTPGSQYRAGDYKFDEFIAADRLHLYPWEMRGARWEGRPHIRPLYGPWFRKDFIQRLATIWAQKVGAPVPEGYYPDDWEEDIIDRFEEHIQSLRGTAPADAYFVGPKSPDGQTPEVRFAGADAGEVDRMRGLLDGENLELAHGSGRKSQMLGETSSGSRALGDTQGRTDVTAMQAIAEWICEIETHGAGNRPGTIEKLVSANYANVKAYPRLVCEKIDPLEGLETMPHVLQAVEKGLVPKHPDIMRQVTERLGYTLSDDVYEELAAEQEAAREALKKNMEQGRDGDTGDDDGEGQETAENGDDENADMAALASTDEIKKRLTALLQPMEGRPSRGSFRRPNRLESEYVMLAEVQQTFRVGEQSVLGELRRIRMDMTKTLRSWLQSGKVAPRNIESLRQAKYKGMKRAERSLVPVIDQIGKAGMQHVEAELKRMREA